MPRIGYTVYTQARGEKIMLNRIALFLEALPLIPRLILAIGLIMVAVGFVEVLSTIESWQDVVK
jgi:hypothetical protein